MKEKQIILNQIRTPDGTILTSKHRHDFNSHVDKNGETYIVDGGIEYLKRSINKEKFHEMSLYTGDQESKEADEGGNKKFISLQSDIHNEFRRENYNYVNRGEKVAVFAGDIGVGEYAINYIKGLAELYPDTHFIFVPGNHEYYNPNLAKDTLDKTFRSVAKTVDNLHFLNRDSVVIDGIKFLGCTLWSDFTTFGPELEKLALNTAKYFLNDFREITNNGFALTPKQMASWQKIDVNWLDTELAKPFFGKTVIVTHFPGVIECVHPHFEVDAVTTYFNNDLEWIVEKHKIDLWLYGHNHWSTSFTLKKTRFYSNQPGYPREQTGHDENLKILL
ncbi:metallophosphoesterase [Dasania marina]|uniref:metallophosphoesterase n=1 Tax=Dasania marina TaxID=471499 RepID=UPI00037FBFC8|nr:metallophosphoesterase [Dasania marina]